MIFIDIECHWINWYKAEQLWICFYLVTQCPFLSSFQIGLWKSDDCSFDPCTYLFIILLKVLLWGSVQLPEGITCDLKIAFVFSSSLPPTPSVINFIEYITSFSQKMQKMAELRSLAKELLGKNIGNGVSLDILLLAIHSLRASALFSLLIFLPTECGFQESGKCLFYFKKR